MNALYKTRLNTYLVNCLRLYASVHMSDRVGIVGPEIERH